MRYVLFIATDPAGEKDESDVEEWVREGAERGIRLDGNGLQPPREAKIIRQRKGEVLVTDGPFPEAAEWIAGYDLIEAADLDEAIDYASRHPMATAGRIEIRPVDALVVDGKPEPTPYDIGWSNPRFMAIYRADPTAEQVDDAEDKVIDEILEGREQTGRESVGIRLRLPDDATLVRKRGGELLVTDGPYAEVEEWVAGVGFFDGEWDEVIDLLGHSTLARIGCVELREFWRE